MPNSYIFLTFRSNEKIIPARLLTFKLYDYTRFMKHLLSACFLLLSSWAFATMDSVIVFKIAAGLNYHRQTFTRDYQHPYYTHFSGGAESLQTTDTSSYSPIIRTGMQLLVAKRAGVEFDFSYNRTKLAYSVLNARSGYDPIDTVDWSMNSEAKYRFISHNIGFSAGAVLYMKDLYVSPKLNFLFIINKGSIDSTYDYSEKRVTSVNISEKTTSEKNYQKTIIGGGLAMGYCFRAGRTRPFIELQANLYNNPGYFERNQFEASFCLGLRF
jgi:hypothetical protein